MELKSSRKKSPVLSQQQLAECLDVIQNKA